VLKKGQRPVKQEKEFLKELKDSAAAPAGLIGLPRNEQYGLKYSQESAGNRKRDASEACGLSA